MKIHITVEIAGEREMAQALELIKGLRALSTTLEVRDVGGEVRGGGNVEIVESLRLTLERIEDAETAEAASTVLEQRFADAAVADRSGGTMSTTLFDEFAVAFMGAMEKLAMTQKTVYPLFSVLPHVPKQFGAAISDRITRQIIMYLNRPRPLNCSRKDFFAHAEAFSALVTYEFVVIGGAITTIRTMLNEEATRAAAVTMLGTTVQHCLTLLNEKCDADTLEALKNTLLENSSKGIEYDIEYVFSNMGWQSPSDPAHVEGGRFPPPVSGSAVVEETREVVADSARSPVAAVAAVQQANGRGLELRAKKRFQGHSVGIFALALNSVTDELISAAKDGVVTFWRPDGSQLGSLRFANHYACAMDLCARQDRLLVCGLGIAGRPAPPSIISISATASESGRRPTGPWGVDGILERSEAQLVSCVKAMPTEAQNNLFLASESGSKRTIENTISLYDIEQSPSFGELSPIRSWAEHNEIITAVTICHAFQSGFLTSSRDGTIKLWDLRAQKSVGSLVSPEYSGVVAHRRMVTTMDSLESFVLSGGVDGNMLLWDVRRLEDGLVAPLKRMSIGDAVILKIAVGAGLQGVAVSTIRRLHLVDFLAEQIREAEYFPDMNRTPQVDTNYHDLRWNLHKDALFAASDSGSVDQYECGPQSVA